MSDVTPYAQLGADRVAAIVDRFYDLMENDPAFAGLRAMHGADLAPMRSSLTGFLTAWLGGPRDWFSERPGACLMSMHGAMPITPELGGQWIAAMDRAIAAEPGVAPELAATLTTAIGRVARAMARIPEAA
ncbi:MAG: globin [Sphingomonas sp.]|jgi:hemoglobin|uniref:globin domain-containing protein n=1 Tax=Sphingomonas sp. TaxID=28214 RepID=UPI0035686FD4